jgi:hypothetical protein
MDTSTTPPISPILEPETTMALMLRYVEDHEEAAYEYACVMLRSFMFDLNSRDAFRLVRNIITETTNDIRNFEGEEMASRIDVALRRLIDRVEAELAD